MGVHYSVRNGQRKRGLLPPTPDPVTDPVVVNARNVDHHPFRGSHTPGAADGTWSIWNTPIGQSATLVDAGLNDVTVGGKTISTTIRIDPIHISYPGDPIKTLTTSDPRLPGFSQRVRVQADDTAPGDYSKGNSICALTSATDPTRFYQGHPLGLTAGGDPKVSPNRTGYLDPTTADDKYGQGHYGAHGGAHMNALGCIRKRAWDAPEEDSIKNAIGYNIWCAAYLRGKAQGETTGHKWPANSADSYWDDDGQDGRPLSTRRYGQHTTPPPSMKMGALLTLDPSWVTPANANAKARKIIRAVRDFGLYIVDDSAWEVHQLSVERTIAWPSSTVTDFHGPLYSMFRALKVVVDNSPTNVGGAGTRRAPLVPDVTRP